VAPDHPVIFAGYDLDVADRYVYVIALSNYDGAWRNVRLAQSRQTLEGRKPRAIARALLEDWVVDNPDLLAGGERIRVYGDDAQDYPPDDYAHVRVWVYRGTLANHDQSPAAAAYLLDLPNE
jgi:hypothetical protein